MSDKPPMMPPQAAPFPGSRTPGWNDPPTLQYNPLSGSGSGARARLNLNKRVAFPLQGTTSAVGNVPPKPTAVVQPHQTISYASPPPIAAIPPLSIPQSSASGSNSSNPIAVVHPTVMGGIMPTDNHQQILHILRNQVRLVQEDVPNKREEIERRLDIIGQLWQSGVLSSEVQSKLCQLSKAIEEANYVSAMDSYTTLATNHSNECASWVVALRHLVLTLQTSTTSMTLEPTNLNPQAPVLFVPAVPRISNEHTNEPILYNPIQHI